MKLVITTKVWVGEYDASEFPEGHTLVKDLMSNQYLVTEVIEFDPERTEIKFEV